MTIWAENSFSGRKIAVCGGCGGIGRDLVSQLVNAGAEVIVLDLAQSLERHALPAGVTGLAIDARDPASVSAAFAKVADSAGALDGLVNLIGFAREKKPVAGIPDELWDEVIDGNLNSAFYIARAAMPLLLKGRDAAIVITSSGLGVRTAPGYGPYSVSKAGVLALTKLLAQEGAPSVRANAVAPSAVDTAFLRGGTGRGGDDTTDPARLDVAAYLKSIPLGRMAQAPDVTGPIMFLLSPASAYMTGQTLHVNGGLLMV